jgi:DNA-binding beta-propeller fold protein YncE
MRARLIQLMRTSVSVALVVAACQGGACAQAAAGAPGVRTVRLDPWEGPAVLDGSTGHLFLGNSAAHTVEMRSAVTGVLLSSIPVGSDPIELLLAGRQGRLFVSSGKSSASSGGVLIVDTHSGRALHSVTLPCAQPILADAATGRVLVSAAASGVLAGRQAAGGAIVILEAATGRVIARIGLAGAVYPWAFDARRHRVVVAYSHDDGVHPPVTGYGLVDLRSGTFLPIADHSQSGHAPILDEQRGIAVLLDTGASTVHVVDVATGKVLHVVGVRAVPATGAIDPRTGHAFIVSQGAEILDGKAGNGTVSALDPATGRVLYRTMVGDNATGISLDAAGDRAYVALGSGELAVLDTTTGRLLATTRVGALSDDPPVVEVHGYAYAMSFGDVMPGGSIDLESGGRLRVLGPRDGRLLRTLSLGPGASWPPLEDRAGGQLLFASSGPFAGKAFFPYGRGTVSVVNAATGTLGRRIAVGMGPTLIGRDPGSGMLLVLNAYGDGTVPPASGSNPVCSATTQQAIAGAPPCRRPYASLSIIPPQIGA